MFPHLLVSRFFVLVGTRGIGGVTYCDNDCVTFYMGCFPGDYHRTTSSRSVRFAELHLLNVYTNRPTCVISNDFSWGVQKLELDTFFDRVMNFLSSSW